MTSKLHQLFNGLQRYRYPFTSQLAKIPKNGIYVQFEAGERFGDLDRIVRIGTDTGQDQLHSRLFQHFENENQRRSVFRRHIGRCLLARSKDPYLPYWDLDFTSRADREKNKAVVDLRYEAVIEASVSHYIRGNISFCVFEVNDMDQRLFWEAKLISTIAQSGIQPSSSWLGNHSPHPKIRSSGLWQVQGLNGPKLTPAEFVLLQRMLLR